MEVSTPLNQAHFYVRKAEKLTKTGKFEEAIALQDRIVDQLQLALLEAEDTKVRESLELQIEFHRKEKGLISERAAQWEHFCRQLTSLQLKMSSASVSDGLQDSIFRTFQETESLLEHLRLPTLKHRRRGDRHNLLPFSKYSILGFAHMVDVQCSCCILQRWNPVRAE